MRTDLRVAEETGGGLREQSELCELCHEKIESLLI